MPFGLGMVFEYSNFCGELHVAVAALGAALRSTWSDPLLKLRVALPTLYISEQKMLFVVSSDSDEVKLHQNYACT